MTTFDELRDHCLKTERGGTVIVKETYIVTILKQDMKITAFNYNLLTSILHGNIDRLFGRIISLV